MVAYAIRRLLLALLTLVLITFVVYGLVRAMPGDPAAAELRDSELLLTPRQIEELRRSFLLDRHWTVAYLGWLGRVASGDFGRSLHQREPVAALIGRALGPTLLLAATSLGLAYVLSVPLGVLSARRAGTMGDRALGALLYALYSVPSYALAVLLVLVFSVELGWLPVSGMRSADHEELSALGKAQDLFVHMLLPASCYGCGALAYSTLFVRSTMREVLEQEFVRAARARGLPETRVIWNHAFRNALVPFVTLVGLSLPALLGGSVILEKLFRWPGMGSLFFDAIRTYDYPLVMGLALAYSVVVLAGNLLADLLYAVVDPRISLVRGAYGER